MTCLIFLQLFSILPLPKSIWNITVLLFDLKLGRKPSFKHCLSCKLALFLCKLLNFVNQNPQIIFCPDGFRSSILPIIFPIRSMVFIKQYYFANLLTTWYSSHALLIHVKYSPITFQLQHQVFRFHFFRLPGSILYKIVFSVLMLCFAKNSFLSWFILYYATKAASLCFNSSITIFSVLTLTSPF